MKNNEISESDGSPSRPPPAKKNLSVKIDIDKMMFLKLCVGLVTVQNMPFRIFDDHQIFKKILAPFEKVFATNLNSRNIVSLMEACNGQLERIITERIKHKMLSLKVDIASRMEKNTLGVYIQYIADGKICTNTIGMILLTKNHKATYLKDEILKCLRKFKIGIKQLYSNTTDNGANVLRVSKILQVLQEMQCADEQPHEDPDHESYDEIIHGSLASVFSVVQCAAHTIQLAAYDVLKNCREEINKCRAAIKYLPQILPPDQSQHPMPTLDNCSRWNSTFEMLESLLALKDSVWSNFDEASDIPNVNWCFVNDLTTAFRPFYKCTNQLQTEQYIIGDFYRDWLSCELELELLYGTTPLAKPLHDAMQTRKQSFIQADAFVSAIYMDPRFNFAFSRMLTDRQKLQAQQHLQNTYNMMRSLQNIDTDINTPTSCSAPTLPSSEAPSTSAAAYSLLAQRISDLSKVSAASDTPRSFKEKIVSLSDAKSLALDANILNYYNCSTDANIKKVAQVVLAAPVMQERAFSPVALDLPRVLTKLEDKNIKKILFLKLNFEELLSADIDFKDVNFELK